MEKEEITKEEISKEEDLTDPIVKKRKNVILKSKKNNEKILKAEEQLKLLKTNIVEKRKEDSKRIWRKFESLFTKKQENLEIGVTPEIMNLLYLENEKRIKEILILKNSMSEDEFFNKIKEKTKKFTGDKNE